MKDFKIKICKSVTQIPTKIRIHNLHYEKFADGSVKCIEDEIPFDVPEGWAWCRLGTLFSTITGSTPSTKDTSLYGDEYPFYKPTDLDAGFNVYSSEASVSEKGYQGGRILPEYSVLVTCIGTIGKTGYIRNSGICNQQINAILPNEFLTPEYTYFCMCSEFEQQQIWTNSSATTLPILNKRKFDNLLFPVPSKGQQTLIVERIKELLRFVEIIEAEKNTLQRTIKATKSKILDLAIRGQLVPQNPNDEPASVLLERIRAEKEELIKAGKIKRNKKESVIFKGEDNSYYEKVGNTVENIDDSIPFDIPANWCFVRLKELWELISGRDLSPSEYNDNQDGVPYITGASNFKNGKIELVRWTPSPQVITKQGDLLLTCKGTVGEMAFNDFGNAHIARQIMAIRNIYGLNVEYLSFCISFYIEEIKAVAKGLIPGISREDVLNLILPIPPENYQRLVVSQIRKSNQALYLIEKSLR
jgi:type I restriction enzyme S subunit